MNKGCCNCASFIKWKSNGRGLCDCKDASTKADYGKGCKDWTPKKYERKRFSDFVMLIQHELY